AVDTRDYSAVLDDLVPYRQLIETGLQGVMAAHVSFPEIDPRPAGFSPWWLEDQLRGELGFGGAIFSDDLAMAGAGLAESCADRAELALDAGCDMVLLCNRSEEVPQTIERLNERSSPRSQLHLMRLRGQRGESWQALHESSEWREACSALEQLDVKPTLRLEG
nr:beta-N-acetylhexosaminidase [Gammaproteobacteria bacterium]